MRIDCVIRPGAPFPPLHRNRLVVLLVRSFGVSSFSGARLGSFVLYYSLEVLQLRVSLYVFVFKRRTDSKL